MIFSFNEVAVNYENNPEFSLKISGLFNFKNKVAVCGDNSSGKTSFFHILKGLKEYKGGITVNGKDISFYKDDIVYIGSNPYVQFFNATVADELSFFLYNTGVLEKKIKEEVKRIAGIFKIKYLLNRDPSFLSGGEAVIVLLASFFIMKPEIILIDEIFERLDESCKNLIIKTFNEIINKNHSLIFFITHNPDDIKYAESMVVIKDGEITHGNAAEYAKRYFN